MIPTELELRTLVKSRLALICLSNKESKLSRQNCWKELSKSIFFDRKYFLPIEGVKIVAEIIYIKRWPTSSLLVMTLFNLLLEGLAIWLENKNWVWKTDHQINSYFWRSSCLNKDDVINQGIGLAYDSGVGKRKIRESIWCDLKS